MSQQVHDNNHYRQFASPSLTPSQQYRAGDGAPSANMSQHMGDGVLPNNIIFNINGNTHINNFHHHHGQQYQSAQHNGILGRKVEVDGPQLRFGKDDSSSSLQGQALAKARESQNAKVSKAGMGSRGGKTMISKKLLNQAKSAKHTRVTPKGIMRGQGKGLSGQADYQVVNQHRLLQTAQQANLSQTGRTRDKKAKSQFDFNFNSVGGKASGQGNVTIDYDTQQRRGTLAPTTRGETPGALTGTSRRNDQQRRQASYSFNNLQSLTGKQVGNKKQQKSSKSNRPMSQAKQTTNTTKHRRHKSEVKRTQRPMTKINTLLQGRNSIANHKSSKRKQEDKENLNANNTSREKRKKKSHSQNSRGAAQTVAYKSNYQRLQEGLSISSLSSNSNRVRGQSQGGSSRQNSRGRQHANGSIADQLSKSYFLNSKQLLKHLSPARQDVDNSLKGQRHSGEALFSQQNGQEGASSGLSYRQQPARGRTRSTAATKAPTKHDVKTKQRKTHSHSQSKTHNNQQLSLRQNPNQSNKGHTGVQITDQKFNKQKASITSQPNQANASMNKKAVDKLIKENLRKNKTKQDEECIRKQLEAVRQRQRRAELTQRNQEVRMINASKIHHNATGGAANTQQMDLSAMVPGEANVRTQVTSTSGGERRDKRRAQSCIDYSNKKAGATQSVTDRRGHHSQGRDRQPKEQPLSQQPQNQIFQKTAPVTMTNQGARGPKPRSFVDEINQLTHLVAQEIGKDPIRQQTRAANQKTKNLLNQTAVEPAQAALVYKKPKRGGATGGINKFIEKRKRAEQVKKSMQQTIEVDKQLKIQKNLDNLDKYVKKHLRQKSQPTISQKKASTSGRIGMPQGGKVPQRKQKKPKASVEPVPIGLSEIFQQVYHNPGMAGEIPRNVTPHHQGDKNISVILDSDRGEGRNYQLDSRPRQRVASTSANRAEIHNLNSTQNTLYPRHDNQMEPALQANNLIISKKAASQGKKSNQGSAKQTGKPRMDKTLLTTAGTRAGTHSGAGPVRKNSAQSNPQNQHQRQVFVYQSTSLPGPPGSQKIQEPRGVAQHEIHSLSHQEQATWLARKHPGVEQYERDQMMHQSRAAPPQARNVQLGASKPKEDSRKRKKEARAPSDLAARQEITTAPHMPQYDNGAHDKSRDPTLQLSPHSTEKIRRVHELVALYRCRFKANVSDASVMGTLHSAASVIQIHFRYLRHLREAELRNQGSASAVEDKPKEDAVVLADLDSSGFINSEEEGDLFAPASPEVNRQSRKAKADKRYIETTDKRKGRDTEDKHRYIEQLTPLDWQASDDHVEESVGTGGKDRASDILGHGAYAGEKQYISSVFPGSAVGTGPAATGLHGSQASSIARSSPRQVISEKSSMASISKTPQNDVADYEESKPKQRPKRAQTTSSQPKPKKELPSIDVDAVEEEYRDSQLKKHEPARQSPVLKGQQKTPQVPGLDLNRLNTKKRAADKKEKASHEEDAALDAYGHQAERAAQDAESVGSYNQQTVSSYRGIFNRIGLPLPRSARVKVDYDLVKKDPKIAEQLQEAVRHKDIKGRQVMDEGRRDNLISERTYEINRRRLDRWVSSSYKKIGAKQPEKSERKPRLRTQDELLQATEDERKRLQGLFNEVDRVSARSGTGRRSGRQSGRQYSHMSQSQRAGQPNGQYQYRSGNSNQGEVYTDRDPYGHGTGGMSSATDNKANLAIESGRQQYSKLVELINSSRTSSKPKKDQSASDSRKAPAESSSYGGQDAAQLDVDDVHIQLDEGQAAAPAKSIEEEGRAVNYLATDQDGSQGNLGTDKSLNKSKSYTTMQDRDLADALNMVSDEKDQQSNDESMVDPNQIEILESALRNEQLKVQEDDLSSKSSKPKPESVNIRDPRFFMRQVSDDGEFDSSKKQDNVKEIDESEDEPVEVTSKGKQEMKSKPNPFKQQNAKVNNYLGFGAEDEEIIEDKEIEKPVPADEDRTKQDVSGNIVSESNDEQPKVTPAQVDAQPEAKNIIKVENQLNEPKPANEEPTETKMNQVVLESNNENVAVGHPVSPVSDSQAYEFKIQTGAHSLSSTDSDMAKAIHAANRDYDSPPDLISPKNSTQAPSLAVIDQQETKAEHEQLADQLTNYILTVMMTETNDGMEQLVSRPQLVPQRPTREERYIKYFDQKGIKTNLFAIEKYFDEVLQEVQSSRDAFMKEINRPLSKNQLETLFHMQNSEIGSYDHFQQNLPPVLSLDLYLNLEKRRKESRENPDAFARNGQEVGVDGFFDFENVTDEDLKADGVDRNYLAECQHIHNKVLFDCINDCLQQFRPHGKDGAPMVWSRLSRKLKPTEDFTLEEMFEITKHDLYQMAITQSGTLPRREFVFGGKFDDELFAEIREKKLAGLLCREIIETEPQWLKWDFEEAQTKIDIGDMVLEALVTETIEFLNTRTKPKSAAQSNFEELQQMIQQNS